MGIGVGTGEPLLVYMLENAAKCTKYMLSRIRSRKMEVMARSSARGGGGDSVVRDDEMEGEWRRSMLEMCCL